MKSTVLPENILKCMSAKDRKELHQKTASEVLEAGEAKSERELQKQIVGLLRLKGIEPLVPTFGKKTRMNTGWPDITFAVQTVEHNFQTYAGAWECKLPGQKLTVDQERMAKRLKERPNGWTFAVITSVDDAIKSLRGMGVV